MNGNWAGVLIHGIIIYETRFVYNPPYPGARTLECLWLPHLANCESVCLYIISSLEFVDSTITLTVLNCYALPLYNPQTLNMSTKVVILLGLQTTSHRRNGWLVYRSTGCLQPRECLPWLWSYRYGCPYLHKLELADIFRSLGFNRKLFLDMRRTGCGLGFCSRWLYYRGMEWTHIPFPRLVFEELESGRGLVQWTTIACLHRLSILLRY